MAGDDREQRNPYAINDLRINTGQIVQVDEGWLLNPVSTAPITLLDAPFEIVQAVKRLLEQSYNAPKEAGRDLAALIERYGLVFKELRHTLEAYRLRCFAEFEKLKADSFEYKEAFSEPSETVDQAMTREEIRQVFRECGYSLKQFATERALPYSAVTSHFGGKNTSARIRVAAEQKARALGRIHRQDEVLFALRLSAQELAGVPPTAAEALPIWEGEADAMLVANQIVDRFRHVGAINLDSIRRIDPGGAYGTLWKIHGPTDVLTCAECQQMMQRVFATNQIPEVPIHPGCRCTLLLDISELEKPSKNR